MGDRKGDTMVRYLLSISELAKLKNITSETLRHYDRIDLLKPDYVTKSGRRMYSIRQYEKLGTILELRAIGMSLHEIQEYFNNRNLKKSISMLRRYQQEFEKKLQEQIQLNEILIEKMKFLESLSELPEMETVFETYFPERYMVTLGEESGDREKHAMGGDESNIQPGLDFFRQLAEQGRLDKGEFTLSRIEKGEIGVAIIWDFVGIGYREQIKENNPDADFEICIPEEGSVQSGYTTIINAYTQRPHAAALTREYILSDEGQLNLAKGYAKTVRDIELPADLQAKMIPDEQYQNIRMVEDADAWEQTVAELPTLWNEQVMAYAK